MYYIKIFFMYKTFVKNIFYFWWYSSIRWIRILYLNVKLDNVKIILAHSLILQFRQEER